MITCAMNTCRTGPLSANPRALPAQLGQQQLGVHRPEQLEEPLATKDGALAAELVKHSAIEVLSL